MSRNVLEINDIFLEEIDKNYYYSWNPNERVLTNDLDYDGFFQNFIVKNLPCVVKNLSSNWQCSNKWVYQNKINYNYFIKEYGNLEVPVADCNKIEYNSQCKSTMKMIDFIDYLQVSNKSKLLYLKDWHLKKNRPADNFYEVPGIFGSDWLNEYAQDKNEDDFRFVYIGPKKSWTPLHSDVYSSYSWSVNVFGKKEWLLFPPGEELRLKDKFGNLPLLYDEKSFPDVQSYTVIQESGDGIFVPSGWYHQVTNLQDTISINHNWVNGCNIAFMWKSLQDNLASVEREIADLKNTEEFQTQCQLILKSVFGIDYEQFLTFVIHIAEKRLLQFEKESLRSFDRFSLGTNHILFDLHKINSVFNEIKSLNIFDNNNQSLSTLQNTCIKLSDSILKLI